MDYKLIAERDPNLTATEQILVNRGFLRENISHYLNTTDADNLPFTLIDNIEQGAKMLLRHLADEKPIWCIVDADADGYCSSAILLNYLHRLVPSIVENKIIYTHHPSKQHGIFLEQMPAGVGLVIVPDAGSNDLEAHHILREQGIDVLVIDHHQVDELSKDAVIINNQMCDYPTKSLCGAAMVYKFCQCLDAMLGNQWADDYIDLVSLALTADVMDLRDYETRYLVNRGCNEIRNPFLKTMVFRQSYSLGDEVTSIGEAFYIAPLVNAVTRVGTFDEKFLLFDSMLEWKAYNLVPSTKRGCKGQTEQLVEQSVRTCTNVKSRQTRLQDAAMEQLDEFIQDCGLLDNKLLIIQAGDFPIDKGLTGLIANRFMAKYQRPVMLLNKIIDEAGIHWSGSARGYDKSKLRDFRQFCLNSGLTKLAAGHPNAFGVSFTDENLKKFIDWSNKQLTDFDFTPSYDVDFVYTADDFNGKDILDVAAMKSLWGQGIPEAKIVIKGLRVPKEKLTLMARDTRPTLKITLNNGVDCIKFKSSEEEFDKFYSESGCVTVDILGTCNSNSYRGSTKPQIFIENYDIINRQDYYF